MATAFIHSGSDYFYRMCRAYFEVYGHTVTDCAEAAEVAIIDIDHRTPPTVPGAKLLVFVASSEYQRRDLPKHDLFLLRPVDVDIMMDWILDEMKRVL